MAKLTGKSMNAMKHEIKHKEKTNHGSLQGKCMYNQLHISA